MMRFKPRRALVGLFAVLALSLASTPTAQAAFNDPLFLMRPVPQEGVPPPPRIPPPSGDLEGPCGTAVNNAGQVYVSDYYHDTVDLFDSFESEVKLTYLGQIAGIDAIDGPCGLALDAAGNLYVNDFHRAVIAVGKGVIDGAPLNEARPTGVAVDPISERLYVNERTRIAVYDLAGNRLGQIGEGSLEDGYGLAVSRFAGTVGEIYVPDASDNTVKVYEPTLGAEDPIDVIEGSDTPAGHFTSLGDAALAIDNASGELYVTDNLQPVDTSSPEAVIRVFDATGAYEGRLKYSVVFGLPLGIAVDNSLTAHQGRVYLTTSNTSPGGVYAYPPGAASSAAVPLPEPFSIGKSAVGVAAPAASAGASPAQLATPEVLSAVSGSAASTIAAAHKQRHPKPRRQLKHHHPNKHHHPRRTHR